MNEAQAIALNEKYELSECVELNKQIKFHYRLASMLTDHRAQVIAELAAKARVMPQVWRFEDGVKACYADDVERALAAMQAKLEQAQERIKEQALQYLSLDGQAHELMDKLEQAQADAARYRWLRDTPWLGTDLETIIRLQLNGKWDAAIDAAMKEQG